MLVQTLRASRQSLARAVRKQHAASLRRTLITPTAIRQADMVQDIYLKELKNTKPSPVKAGDEKGLVREFHLPKAPQSPEEADLQNELKSYEEQVPEVEGQGEQSQAPEQDWFEEEVEEDEELVHH